MIALNVGDTYQAGRAHGTVRRTIVRFEDPDRVIYDPGGGQLRDCSLRTFEKFAKSGAKVRS